MSFVAETATLTHGWTMERVDRVAGKCASLRHSNWLDREQRKDVAWHAIVEVLYACGCGRDPDHCTHPGGPTIGDLVAAGCRAIADAMHDEYHHHGYNPRTHDRAPSFGIYWSVTGNHEDFTDRIVERLALPAMLGILTPGEYEAILTLAAHGSQAAAADAVGIKRPAFSARIVTARRRAAEVWFAPETPRDVSKRKLTPDGTCTFGHALSEFGVVEKSGRLRCSECRRRAGRKNARAGRARRRAETFDDVVA